MKNITKLVGVLSIGTLLAACGNGGNEAETGGTGGLADDGVLTIGVTAGPHEDILNQVQEAARADGFEIEVITFNDFVQPNVALVDGELDLNSFQTGPFLENVVEEQGFDIVSVAPNITIPMGIHSESYNDVSEIQKGDLIGVPNSPTQEGRALQLFEEAGLITLPEGSGVEVVVDDIVENPLNLEFVTSEAAQLPTQLPDFDAAAINSNFVLDAGMNPEEDSIFIEDSSDLYHANYFVARAENQDDPAIEQLLEYYQTEEIEQFIEEEFQGAVVPSW